MKKIQLLKYIFLVIMVTGFSGCKKDNLTLLTDGTWKFRNFTTTSDNEDIKNLVALGKAVLTDGTLTFYDDGTYELDAPVMNEPETGSWELVGSTQLIFNDGFPRTASIDDLSKKELVYLETYVYLDTETYTVKYTWVK